MGEYYVLTKGQSVRQVKAAPGSAQIIISARRGLTGSRKTGAVEGQGKIHRNSTGGLLLLHLGDSALRTI